MQQTLMLTRSGVGGNSEIRNVLERVSTRVVVVVVVVVAQPDCLPTLARASHHTSDHTASTKSVLRPHVFGTSAFVVPVTPAIIVKEHNQVHTTGTNRSARLAEYQSLLSIYAP